MNIAIVILNWNGKKLLEQFLPSVVKHSQDATIYVADNASTDDSVEYLKSSFPSVRIIQNSENGGYAKGYNDALKQIKEDVFCLMNNDIEVTKNWLSPIAKTLNSDPNIAIIQPKILDFNNKSYFEYAGAGGGFIDKYGYPYCKGRIFNSIEKDVGQYDEISDIFWSSGACLFIRKRVFEELNGFDEAYFAHMEEIDLCWRAKNFGYDVKYVGNSSVFHLGGATLSKSNPKKTFLNFRNSLFNLVKNAKGNLFLLILVRLIMDGVAGIKFIFEFKFSHFKSIVRAHLSFYSHLSKLLKRRRSLPQSKNYYEINSIVWSYFIRKKRQFNRL
ncbi:MAG: glycosyltransferase family 2 protein [Bacteroidia bacterium]|nr:glycosyltransferase family 2 protein [Bacteroidia bacterium]